jgi:hypothetical protein
VVLVEKIGVKKGRQKIYVDVFAAPVKYATVAPQENFYAPLGRNPGSATVYTRPIGSKSCPGLGPVGPIGSATYASDSATLVTLANVYVNNRDDQKVNFGLQNALNFAYVPLQFPQRNTPASPLERGRME